MPQTPQNRSTYFQHPPTPEQLLEVERRKPAARAALIARLDRWKDTGTIGCTTLEEVEWPAEEQAFLATTS